MNDERLMFMCYFEKSNRVLTHNLIPYSEGDGFYGVYAFFCLR